jgi:hypothetical protein
MIGKKISDRAPSPPWTFAYADNKGEFSKPPTSSDVTSPAYLCTLDQLFAIIEILSPFSWISSNVCGPGSKEIERQQFHGLASRL